MYRLIVIMTFLFAFTGMSAQDSFYLNIDRDTILAGNVLKVEFIVENTEGNFVPPDMSGLPVISGPNSSSSMTIVNGDVNQYASYSYLLGLEDIGEIYIPPAYFETPNETFETEPKSILILPNPEGIIEQAPAESGFWDMNINRTPKQPNKSGQPRSTKKRRKLKKI